MKTVNLKARRRTEKGKRACRNLRRSGEIPVNLYGAIAKGGQTNRENYELAASAYDVMQLLGKHASLLDVTFDGKKEMAVVREVQRDAFGDDVLHIDLVMIDPSKPLELAVDLVLKGESKGKKSGGRMIQQLRQLIVRAVPAKIPAEIVANVEAMDINDTLHVRELQLPEGVTTTVNPEAIIVQCLPPMSEEELAAQSTAAAAPGEPEVIAKGKAEEEGAEGEAAAPAAGGGEAKK
jgi:large subunit ribosomal protein L25